MLHDQKYSTEEFIERLNSNNLGPQPLLFGKVKIAGNKNELLFAFKGDWENWIAIPTKMIEHVHYFKSFTKNDEKIALVKIHLKPASNPEAKMFADILFALESKVMKWHIKKMMMHEKMEEGMGMHECPGMMHSAGGCGCGHMHHAHCMK